MLRKEIQGNNGEGLVFIIPDTTVNHATHINLSTLEDGKAFILESVCVMPLVFNKQPNNTTTSTTGALNISVDEVPPFSRILISRETLEALAKTIKSLGINV